MLIALSTTLVAAAVIAVSFECEVAALLLLGSAAVVARFLT
jgi:hypothetical protein